MHSEILKIGCFIKVEKFYLGLRLTLYSTVSPNIVKTTLYYDIMINKDVFSNTVSWQIFDIFLHI